MYHWIRPFLFRLDPEQAHALTLGLIRLASILPPVRTVLRTIFHAPPKPVGAFGLFFTNPVGLAAGYDKNGLGWYGLACLGFGHIEVGTVTPRPQVGNPRPRLFRLPEDEALINRMGFPGRGAPFVAQQLKRRRTKGLVLGVNLGKNKDTPLESAAQDYVELVRMFAPLADYLAINVSSPNTVGLRRLQGRQALEGVLLPVEQERQEQVRLLKRNVPLLVKLSPDLSEGELDGALEALLACGVDGVIATNTTLARPGLHSRLANETGGLSGAPLRASSTQIIRTICQRTGGKLPIIGVGGILNAAEAQEKLDAGALLVQVYTGLIYNGPGLARSIISHLV